VAHPTTSLFRVTFEILNDAERTVTCKGGSRRLTVVAKDGKTAMDRAIDAVEDELEPGKVARVSGVEFVESVEVP
jgi:hypothetical protein